MYKRVISSQSTAFLFIHKMYNRTVRNLTFDCYFVGNRIMSFWGVNKKISFWSAQMEKIDPQLNLC